jgi:hypothetical protein
MSSSSSKTGEGDQKVLHRSSDKLYDLIISRNMIVTPESLEPTPRDATDIHPPAGRQNNTRSVCHLYREVLCLTLPLSPSWTEMHHEYELLLLSFATSRVAWRLYSRRTPELPDCIDHRSISPQHDRQSGGLSVSPMENRSFPHIQLAAGGEVDVCDWEFPQEFKRVIRGKKLLSNSISSLLEDLCFFHELGDCHGDEIPLSVRNDLRQ